VELVVVVMEMKRNLVEVRVLALGEEK